MSVCPCVIFKCNKWFKLTIIYIVSWIHNLPNRCQVRCSSQFLKPVCVSQGVRFVFVSANQPSIFLSCQIYTCTRVVTYNFHCNKCNSWLFHIQKTPHTSAIVLGIVVSISTSHPLTAGSSDTFSNRITTCDKKKDGHQIIKISELQWEFMPIPTLHICYSCMENTKFVT